MWHCGSVKPAILNSAFITCFVPPAVLPLYGHLASAFFSFSRSSVYVFFILPSHSCPVSSSRKDEGGDVLY